MPHANQMWFFFAAYQVPDSRSGVPEGTGSVHGTVSTPVHATQEELFKYVLKAASESLKKENGSVKEPRIVLTSYYARPNQD